MTWKPLPQSDKHEINEHGVIRRAYDHRVLKQIDGCVYVSPHGTTIRVVVAEVVRELFGVELIADSDRVAYWLRRKWRTE